MSNSYTAILLSYIASNCYTNLSRIVGNALTRGHQDQEAKLFDVRGLINAFIYSFAGFKEGIQHHTHFRLAIVVTILFTPVAIFIGDDAVQRALLVFALLLVPILELINSAIEITVDRISLEHHQLSKKAKDLASAAVSLSVTNAVVIWSLIIFA